ncbi:Superoxide dismutase [Mn], mitochondrial [Fonsecaea pedrosoi]|nr:Superoxide dismutase [Mn], mitochondrial [Fonsecaea pedrosoi]
MPVTYELPPLQYSLDIMDLHYNRHHRAYITNLNAALGAQAEAAAANNLVKQLELQAAINFNAGGHINHTLFWESLAPASSGLNNLSASAVAPTLSDAITKRWGSVDAFKAAFESSALAIQGSGWQWLVQDPQTKTLELTTSKDQDLPKGGKGIVLGVDMWEHAYYLQYFNNKKEYLNKIWDVVNWQVAEKRFKGDPRAAFGALAGLAGHL